MNFSACDKDFIIYFKNDLVTDGNMPDVESFYACFETLLDDEAAATWRREREAAQKQEWRKAKERIERAREKEIEAAKAKAEAEEDQHMAADLTLAYMLWQSAWEADLVRKKLLTTFPHLPVRVCICVEVSCTLRKVDSGLLACHHDVERLLRASGMYNLAWLRKERIPWHPDRFGLRCDPDFRKELKRKATEMYAIFETLIEEEKTRDQA